MFNVNDLYEQLNGSSFATGKKLVSGSAPIQPATTQPVHVAPKYATAADLATPYYDPSRTFTYTREQIEQMRQRNLPFEDLGPLKLMEITDPQTREDGDGAAIELEIEAEQQDATEKAVASGGAEIDMSAPTPDKAKEFIPLAAVAALLYYVFL